MDRNENQLVCDAILFDLDGVLIDSTSCVVRHWTRWAGQHGLDINDIMAVAHGMRTIETIRRFAPQLDAAKEAAQYLEKEVADTAGIVAIDGANQLLKNLPDNAWAIVTSGSRALAEARLQKAALPVPSAMVTADEVTRGKPAPEPYVAGAKRLGVSVGQCVVIEDAPAGIEAGRSAGMRVIGITSTHQREALIKAGAHIVVDHLAHLNIQETAGKCRLVISTRTEFTSGKSR